MNRTDAQEIVDIEDSTRCELVRNFIGCHPYTVAESLVIWAQLPDCPSDVSNILDQLRDTLSHCPEFTKGMRESHGTLPRNSSLS